MVDTLEGPGVVESKCPTCARPGWARELLPNRKLEALVGHLLADRQAGAHLFLFLEKQQNATQNSVTQRRPNSATCGARVRQACCSKPRFD